MLYKGNFVFFKAFVRHTSTLPAPCISESCIKIKINLNFYFHTSLWCLKRPSSSRIGTVRIKVSFMFFLLFITCQENFNDEKFNLSRPRLLKLNNRNSKKSCENMFKVNNKNTRTMSLTSLTLNK